MIKLGIVGAGRLGGFHADKAAAHSDVELVGVTDVSEPARKNLAQKHGIREFATLEEMIPAVQAVVIASPTVLHYEIGEVCLQYGLHILMEKPMCNSLHDARKLIELAKRADVVFQVGHVEAFNPAWISAQDSLHEVKAGFPVMIDAVRTSGYTFRSTDVGAVFDMMIHDLDLILSLVPSKIASVDAIGFNVIGGPHEDIVNARIHFENGTIANLRTSRIEPKAVREMSITTPTCTTVIDFGTRKSTYYRPDERVLNGQFAPSRIESDRIAEIAPAFMKEHFSATEITNDAVDALAMEMNDFVESIQTGRSPRVSGDRALAAVDVAERILDAVSHNIKRKAA